MDINTFKELKNIGDSLEKEGAIKEASIITGIMSNLLEIKTSQYVGSQGYLIRGKRCFDNCYRQKRLGSPDKAAQEVWTDCWKEYLESINNDNSGWEKYADEKSNIKVSSKNLRDKDVLEINNFVKSVEKEVLKGASRGEAIYSVLMKNSEKCNNDFLKNIETLSSLSAKLKDAGMNEIGEKIAQISLSMIKKADFADQQNIFQKGWDWARGNKPYSDANVIKRLQNMLRRINNIFTIFQTRGEKTSSDLNRIVEAVTMPTNPQPEMPPQILRRRNEYHSFIKDLRDEIVTLGKLARTTADPNTTQLLQQVISAAQSFISKNDTIASSGEGSYNFRTISPFLRELHQSVVRAMSGISDESAPVGGDESISAMSEEAISNAIQKIAKDPSIVSSVIVNAPMGRRGLLELVGIFEKMGVPVNSQTIGKLISSIPVAEERGLASAFQPRDVSGKFMLNKNKGF